MSEQREQPNLICQMITAAVFAGAYWAKAREIPEAAPGLLKMARKHSARAAALASEIREIP